MKNKLQQLLKKKKKKKKKKIANEQSFSKLDVLLFISKRINIIKNQQRKEWGWGMGDICVKKRINNK